MTTTVTYLVSGLLSAAVWVALLRIAPRPARPWLHAAMLTLVAALYVDYAAKAGEPGGLVVELAGTALFGGVAAMGVMRRAPRLLALGWAFHPLWDVALHTRGVMAGYTPPGHVVSCIAYDLLFAAVIARGWAGLWDTARNSAPAPA